MDRTSSVDAVVDDVARPCFAFDVDEDATWREIMLLNF